MVARKVLFHMYTFCIKNSRFLFSLIITVENCQQSAFESIDSQNNLYSFIPEPVKTFVIKFV